MEFTIVFWNIWLNTQLAGESGPLAKKLLKKLDEIIDQYKPDCIGLNEVLQETSSQRLFVLEHLKKRGYIHQEYAYASPVNDDWAIGLALVSRHPLKDIDVIDLGADMFAKWRGYKGYTVKALGARVELTNKRSVQIMAAHPHALKPAGLPIHWEHQKALRVAAAKPRYKQLILGGDFNEPNLMPFSFTGREKDRFYHRSGTLKNPTWSHHGEMSRWMRCNLDKVFWTKEKTTELLEFKVLNSSPSDHSPLLARFKI